MTRSGRSLLFVFGLLLAVNLLPPKNVLANPLVSIVKQQAGPNPQEVINAVNNLRLAHGLPPLNVHPVLMQVAQAQADALAGTEGAVGHARPNGISLGQQLLLLGFPLSGDLTLDGYRSENWVAASTAQGAIEFWLGDDPHTNTMLSQYRSDIGAGVASSDQIYIVIETALQTSTGRMQSEAYDILTGIPMTQAVFSGDATQSADSLLVPQYSVPVAVSTARPDGNVFHEVKYGQSLWSIAIQYHTKIDQIQALNNLGTNTIVHPGDILLIQKGATQPAPVSLTPNIFPTYTRKPTAYPIGTLPPTHATAIDDPGSQGPSFGFGIGLLAFAIVILAIIAASLIREPT